MLVFLPGIGEIRRVEARLAPTSPADVDVVPLAGALTLAEQDAALAASPSGPPAGRAGHRHRRDVAHGRRRARRRRRRPRPRAALRRRHGHDPAHDGLDQPRLGRPARRPRRTHRARASPTGCGASSSTAPAGPPASPRSPRSTSPGSRSSWPHGARRPDELAFIDPPPARALAPGRGLLDRARCARRAAGSPTLGRQMLGLPVHPRLARMVAADATRRWRASSPRSSTSATCSAAAPTSCPADLALRVAPRRRRRPPRPRRPRRRRPAPRPGGRHRPPRPASRSTAARVDADRAGACLLLAYPDRLAGRRRAGPVPAPHRRGGVAPGRRPAGRRAVRRRRRPRRQARPAPGSGSARRSPPTTSSPCSPSDLVEHRRARVGRATATISSSASSAGSARIRLGRPEPPRRSRAPRRRRRCSRTCRRDEPGRSCGGRADVDAAPRARSRSCTARARRAVARLERRGAARPARRMARARTSPARPAAPTSSASTSSIVLRSQLPWPAGAELDELAPRDVARTAGRAYVPIDYSADAADASRSACRTCSASRAIRRRRRPRADRPARCSRRPTARSRSPPTCPGSGPGHGPRCARRWPAATRSTTGRPTRPTPRPAGSRIGDLRGSRTGR